MNKEEISTYIFLIIIGGIILISIELINKKVCENNGGVYIWSSNQYEQSCHIKGEENE